MRPIGILGGTFDPIHRGHIELAREAYKQLDLEQVRFIPVNIPPHRQLPVASAIDRKAMVESVVAEFDCFVLDDRELKSNAVSYSFNTLESLRRELPDAPLCLLMGSDAFEQIDSWFRWQELPELVHIIVAQRQGTQASWSTRINTFISERRAYDAAVLGRQSCGLFYFMTFPPVDISATAVRHALATTRTAGNWLHKSTLDYIKQHDLYRNAA